MKKIFFSFLVIFLTVSTSCEDKFVDKHAIPYVAVYAEIQLWMAEYQDLKFSYQPVYLGSYNGKGLGYNHNGLIVMKIADNEYKCFDATCTNDLSGSVSITKGSTMAKCPVCGTEFLLTYGYPIHSSDSTNTTKIYPLREYPVVASGNSLIVRN